MCGTPKNGAKMNDTDWNPFSLPGAVDTQTGPVQQWPQRGIPQKEG